jgi:hypothetical protein
LETLEIFHDPTVFDPFDEDAYYSDADTHVSLPKSDSSNAPDEIVLDRQVKRQRDSHHILDHHVDMLLDHLGPKLKSISLEGVLGLTGRTLDSIRLKCPNLEYIRIRFCLDESASPALERLLIAKPQLKSLRFVGLGHNLFHAGHLKLAAQSMPNLRFLKIDTDGATLPFSPEDVVSCIPPDVDCFPSLKRLHLSRTHGGFPSGVVVPILKRLVLLEEATVTCALDPIVKYGFNDENGAGKKLKTLKVMAAIDTRRSLTPSTKSGGDDGDVVDDDDNGNGKDDDGEFFEETTSDEGLKMLAVRCPALTEFHLFCAPNVLNHTHDYIQRTQQQPLQLQQTQQTQQPQQPQQQQLPSNLFAASPTTTTTTAPTSPLNSNTAVPISDKGLLALVEGTADTLEILSVQCGFPLKFAGVGDGALSGLIELARKSTVGGGVGGGVGLKSLRELHLETGEFKFSLGEAGSAAADVSMLLKVGGLGSEILFPRLQILTLGSSSSSSSSSSFSTASNNDINNSSSNKNGDVASSSHSSLLTWASSSSSLISKPRLESFIQVFCPRIVRFRYVDFETGMSKTFTKAGEGVGESWWEGWEEDEEDEESDEDMEEDEEEEEEEEEEDEEEEEEE